MSFITNIPKERFNEFVSHHQKNHFAQSYEWGTFKANSDEWDFDTVGLEDRSGNLVAAALVLIRHLPAVKRPFIYVPRGFVIDFNNKQLLSEFVTAFKSYAKSKKAIFFKIDPDIKYVNRDVEGNITSQASKNDMLINNLTHIGFKHLGFAQDFDSTIQPRYTFRLDLKDDEQALLEKFHSKTRYNIRVAEKKGVEIFEATREDLTTFEEIMKVTGQRDGFLIRPLSYFEKMYDELNPSGMCKLYLARLNTKIALENVMRDLANNAKLVNQYKTELANEDLTDEKKEKLTKALAEERGKRDKLISNVAESKKIYNENPKGIVMAGILTTHYGNKSWYLYGASNNSYRELMPNYLIQWHAITEAKKAGYEIYDLFGISGRTDKEDPLHGLYRFKKGFGGEFTEFIGEFDYVVSPLYYFAWSKVLPLFKKHKNKLKLETEEE